MQSRTTKGCPFIPVCAEYRHCSACCLIPGIEKRCEFRPDLRADKKTERMIEMSNSTQSLEKAQQIVSLLEGFSRSEWRALRDSVERAFDAQANSIKFAPGERLSRMLETEFTP